MSEKITQFLTSAELFVDDEWDKAIKERPDLRKLDIDTGTHTNISYSQDGTETVYFVRTRDTQDRRTMVSIMPLDNESALEVLNRRVNAAKK